MLLPSAFNPVFMSFLVMTCCHGQEVRLLRAGGESAVRPPQPKRQELLDLSTNAVAGAGVMGDAGVKHMVDLGCGEGKLLEHLVRSQDCPSLTHMVGNCTCISFASQCSAAELWSTCIVLRH